MQTDEFDSAYKLSDYWFDLGVGLGAGMLLGVVSRITSALCGGGRLLHESYMTFWASLITVVLAPLFFGAYIYHTNKTIKTSLTAEQTVQLIEVLSALFILTLFKSVYLERDIMKRFVEDFDSEVHAINEEADEPGRHAEVQVQEFDDDIMEVRRKKAADLTAS